MCRMFGFRSAVPTRAHRSLVEAENALSDQSNFHPDGWGIGWFVEDEAMVIKSANAAHASERFKRASSRLKSHTFVVHVRRATVGVVDHINAHPFTFGRWLFAHNGTLFAFDDGLRAWMEERIADQFIPVILGDTDSEHLFYYLLSGLADAGMKASGRGEIDGALMAQVVRDKLIALDDYALQHKIDRPIVNVILTDGRTFVAHRAGMPLLLSTQKRFCNDFPTCEEPTKVCMAAARPAGTSVNHMLVASEQIASDENVWEDVADGSTLLLTDDFMLSIQGPPDSWVAPELPEWARRKAPA